MLKYFFISSLAFFSLKMQAQNNIIDRSKELQVGALLPDWPAFPIINYNKKTIQLQKIKNKVVVLDFFDTYCSNCIESMPKLNNLQKEQWKEVDIIMVTWQDRQTIEKFFQTNKYLQEHPVKLPIIYNDTLLRKYFPHSGVPHVAWLYNGKVQAITHSDFINAKNIHRLFEDRSISLPRKNDFPDVQQRITSNIIGSATVARYKDGMPASGLKIEQDSANRYIKSSFYNMDILGAYTSTWSQIKKIDFIITPGRTVWEVKNPSLYKQPEFSGNPNEWLVDNGISYERYDIIKRTQKEQALLVLQDLNNFLGIDVFWDKRIRKCIVIRKNGKPVQADNLTKDGQHVGGVAILAFLMDYSGEYPPVIDESSYKEKMTIPGYKNLMELNKTLSFYGLEAIEAEREIEVLVFKEKKQ